MTTNTTRAIKYLIVKYWDFFCFAGTQWIILGYEFYIGIGTSSPVCCLKPTYGPHKEPIIMEQIIFLFNNDWIREYGGSWGSHFLAARPHQEDVDYI